MLRLGDEWSDICYQPQLTEAMSLLSVSSTSASASSATQTKSVAPDKRKLIETASKSMPLDENSIDTDSQSTGQGEPSSKCFMNMSLDGSKAASQNPQTLKANKTITSILSTAKNRTSDAERSTDSVDLSTSSAGDVSERPLCDDTKKTVSFSDQMEHIDGTIAPQRRPKDVVSVSSKHPSITERLPANTYYCDPPNLYVFPGAEIWWDDDDESSYADDDEDDDANDTQDDDDDDVDDDDDDIEINCDETNETKTLRNVDDFTVRLNCIDDEMARQSPPNTPASPANNTTNAKGTAATKRRRRSSSTTRMDCAQHTDVTLPVATPSAEKKRKLCDMNEITSISTVLTASMTPAKRCATPQSVKTDDI